MSNLYLVEKDDINCQVILGKLIGNFKGFLWI
jgi:hypothetical protein